jgi:hypothetical protein
LSQGLHAYCREIYKKAFAQLDTAQQEAVITALEQGKATGFTWPSGPAFFNTLRALKQDTEPLDRVLGAGRHLLALINDILDLSKIEAGRMELQLEDFALAPLIQSVVKTVEPLAAKSGNHLAVLCDDAIGTLHADSMRLRQALLNLMSNAKMALLRDTYGSMASAAIGKVAAGAAQSHEQRQQVYGARNPYARRDARAA